MLNAASRPVITERKRYTFTSRLYMIQVAMKQKGAGIRTRTETTVQKVSSVWTTPFKILVLVDVIEYINLHVSL